MIWIHTLSSTLMADDKTFWYLAVRQFPSNSVCFFLFLFTLEISVSILIFTTQPFPTFVRISSPNLAPKSIFHTLT